MFSIIIAIIGASVIFGIVGIIVQKTSLGTFLLSSQHQNFKFDISLNQSGNT